MITAQCKRRDGHMPLREHKDKNEASEVSVPLAGCAEQSCQGHSGDLSFFLISLGKVHHLLPQGGAAPGRQSRLRGGNWTCLPQEPMILMKILM